MCEEMCWQKRWALSRVLRLPALLRQPRPAFDTSMLKLYHSICMQGSNVCEGTCYWEGVCASVMLGLVRAINSVR